MLRAITFELVCDFGGETNSTPDDSDKMGWKKVPIEGMQLDACPDCLKKTLYELIVQTSNTAPLNVP